MPGMKYSFRFAFIIPVFILLGDVVNLAKAFSGRAGHCGTGDLSTRAYSGHGDTGNGSLSDGSMQVKFDSTTIQTSSTTSLVANKEYVVTLESTSSSDFRGFLFRLSGVNGVSTDGVLFAGSDGNAQSQSFCSPGISAITHTNARDKSSVSFIFDYTGSIGVDLLLEVTVVQSRRMWYYSAFDLKIAPVAATPAPVASTPAPTPPPTTPKPSLHPSVAASAAPSVFESTEPTVFQSTEPSVFESTEPSLFQSAEPTVFQSAEPSVLESTGPTVFQSAEPTVFQSAEPTVFQSAEPTVFQSAEPTVFQSAEPSVFESTQPTVFQSAEPSLFQSAEPTVFQSAEPSVFESTEPTVFLSTEPSVLESTGPTVFQSTEPTLFQSAEPSAPVAPTPAPVAASTQSPSTSPFCEDTSLRFKVEWNGRLITRDCIWIGNRATFQRCNTITGVSAACPVTCGTCEETCEDTSLRFKVEWNERIVTRDCIWIGNKATIQRCNIKGVAEACPVTCGLCG